MIVGGRPMDGAVARVWEAFDGCWVTHVPIFEAGLAVAAFVAWIALFESAHLWWPRAVEDYRLDGRPPRNLAQIGAAYGLTRERIRQIERAALYKLRMPHRARKLAPLSRDFEAVMVGVGAVAPFEARSHL